MKCFLIACGLMTTLLAAGFVSSAQAQNPGGAGLDLAKARQQAQQRILERYDANKDGKLTGEEQLRAQEELRRSGRLPGSGVVPGGFAGAEEYLKKFDADGDGKLSAAEQLAAQSAMQRNRGRQAAGGPATGPGLGPNNGVPGANLFGDEDDGAAGKEPAGRKPTRRTNPLITLYDKDGDGKLNDEEKAALQADRGKKKPATKRAADKEAKEAAETLDDGEPAGDKAPAVVDETPK
jgi:Ca2+-binding EF-hand superfamily protein